jgi:hypothetical protein
MDISSRYWLVLWRIVQKDTAEVGKNKSKNNVRSCKNENPADAEK